MEDKAFEDIKMDIKKYSKRKIGQIMQAVEVGDKPKFNELVD